MTSPPPHEPVAWRQWLARLDRGGPAISQTWCPGAVTEVRSVLAMYHEIICLLEKAVHIYQVCLYVSISGRQKERHRNIQKTVQKPLNPDFQMYTAFGSTSSYCYDTTIVICSSVQTKWRHNESIPALLQWSTGFIVIPTEVREYSIVEEGEMFLQWQKLRWTILQTLLAYLEVIITC